MGEAMGSLCDFGHAGSPLCTFPQQVLSYPFKQSQGTVPYRAGRAAPMVFVQCLCLWVCVSQLEKLIVTTRHKAQAWNKLGKRRRGTLSHPCSQDIVMPGCQVWINLMTADLLLELYGQQLPWDFVELNLALVSWTKVLLGDSAASVLHWNREGWKKRRV